jgi:hypothetical protein
MKYLKGFKVLKVSFDFDFTLSEPEIQEIASKYISNGDDVWIVTTRFKWEFDDDYKNRDVYSIANKIGIPKDKIVFTNGEIKYLFLDGFDIHYDDNEIEIEFIEDNLPNCKGILVNS